VATQPAAPRVALFCVGARKDCAKSTTLASLPECWRHKSAGKDEWRRRRRQQQQQGAASASGLRSGATRELRLRHQSRRGGWRPLASDPSSWRDWRMQTYAPKGGGAFNLSSPSSFWAPKGGSARWAPRSSGERAQDGAEERAREWSLWAPPWAVGASSRLAGACNLISDPRARERRRRPNLRLRPLAANRSRARGSRAAPAWLSSAAAAAAAAASVASRAGAALTGAAPSAGRPRSVSFRGEAQLATLREQVAGHPRIVSSGGPTGSPVVGQLQTGSPPCWPHPLQPQPERRRSNPSRPAGICDPNGRWAHWLAQACPL